MKAPKSKTVMQMLDTAHNNPWVRRSLDVAAVGGLMGSGYIAGAHGQKKKLSKAFNAYNQYENTELAKAFYSRGAQDAMGKTAAVLSMGLKREVTQATRDAIRRGLKSMPTKQNIADIKGYIDALKPSNETLKIMAGTGLAGAGIVGASSVGHRIAKSMEKRSSVDDIREASFIDEIEKISAVAPSGLKSTLSGMGDSLLSAYRTTKSSFGNLAEQVRKGIEGQHNLISKGGNKGLGKKLMKQSRAAGERGTKAALGVTAGAVGLGAGALAL